MRENNIQPTYDLIGVGFGPAGIALAAVMADDEEETGQHQMDRLFFEKAADSSWQPNMLLSGTDIQHHFLRDFATPRNPRSRFTFPNYLVEKNRLFAFGHLGGVAGRIEWSDYVNWCAQQLTEHVRYRHEVLEVEPVVSASAVQYLNVWVRELETGRTQMFQTRDMAVNVGRIPHIPDLYRAYLGENVFHSHQFLQRLSAHHSRDDHTFVVVGSGQNAIEVILSLRDRYPTASIYSINRNVGFQLMDTGHFSNEVFFPEFTDYFYHLSQENRDKLFEKMKYTNYSVVDYDVSRDLYWKVYEDRVQGRNRLHITRCTQVVDIKREDSRYHLTLEDIYTQQTRTVSADTIILCTGFKEPKMPAILNPLEEYLLKDEAGCLKITRDYRIQTTAAFKSRLFINGLTERTHGISDSTSFSMMALKAQRIYETLKESCHKEVVQGAGK
ncbi:SidA/IucD/PvdA family monooxygenase [Desmospora profundinema]|uniref:L-lysine N6-monooxygenase MbtG n=1 Tax=Desmospora profundinema TaxID=1571184 RepID=A0ABU1IRD8_9BACL|nr:SidA/IucD/PvdA family monooxygenase [Desmospora profundinema]MDR6227353.1 L-ornithine N5-oxygenase [Desmospora profundinema]